MPERSGGSSTGCRPLQPHLLPLSRGTAQARAELRLIRGGNLGGRCRLSLRTRALGDDAKGQGGVSDEFLASLVEAQVRHLLLRCGTKTSIASCLLPPTPWHTPTVNYSSGKSSDDARREPGRLPLCCNAPQWTIDAPVEGVLIHSFA